MGDVPCDDCSINEAVAEEFSSHNISAIGPCSGVFENGGAISVKDVE